MFTICGFAGVSKVMFDCRSDCAALHAEFDCLPAGIVDLQLADIMLRSTRESDSQRLGRLSRLLPNHVMKLKTLTRCAHLQLIPLCLFGRHISRAPSPTTADCRCPCALLLWGSCIDSHLTAPSQSTPLTASQSDLYHAMRSDAGTSTG